MSEQQQEDADKLVRELTAEEEQAIKDAFAAFDKNGNGEITSSEFEEVWRAMGGNPTEADVEEALQSMDRNNDDVVTFDELRQFMIRNPPEEVGVQLAELEAAFGRFDRDKDGTVRLDDLRRVLGRGNKPMSEEEIETLFQDIDSNKDGKVNIGEMTAHLVGTQS